MKNYSSVILGVVFVFGIFAVISLFNSPVTGNFSYGNAGMGRYYSAGGWVQFSPKEACEYVGASSYDPPEVYRNDMGQYMVVCYDYDSKSSTRKFGIPLVQWMTPEPLPDRFNPLS